MAKKRTRRTKRRTWSKQDLRELKAHSRNKSPVKKIATAMKRTAGALRRLAEVIHPVRGGRRTAAIPCDVYEGSSIASLTEGLYYSVDLVLLDLGQNPPHIREMRRNYDWCRLYVRRERSHGFYLQLDSFAGVNTV